MPVPRREPDRPPPVAAGSSTLSAVYGSLSAVTTLEFFEHPLRRWVMGYLLMTQLYPLTRLLLTPRTRKRPPQHGFVQVGFADIKLVSPEARFWTVFWDRYRKWP